MLKQARRGAVAGGVVLALIVVVSYVIEVSR